MPHLPNPKTSTRLECIVDGETSIAFMMAPSAVGIEFNCMNSSSDKVIAKPVSYTHLTSIILLITTYCPGNGMIFY